MTSFFVKELANYLRANNILNCFIKSIPLDKEDYLLILHNAKQKTDERFICYMIDFELKSKNVGVIMDLSSQIKSLIGGLKYNYDINSYHITVSYDNEQGFSFYDEQNNIQIYSATIEFKIQIN